MIIRVTKEKDAYNEWTKEIIYLHKQLLKDNKYGNIYMKYCFTWDNQHENMDKRLVQGSH